MKTDDSHPAGTRGRGAKPDGRKRRWQEHKIARREELVDGTLAAIRKRGANVGMDEIASEIGVSKTVLYRYFTDKSDLTKATMMRYVEVTLVPRINAAVNIVDDEYLLVRSAIGAYVSTIEEDPDIYRYIMGSGNGPGADQNTMADSERMFAGIVASLLQDRAEKWGIEPDGSVPWGFAIVGSVQLATHWWISEKAMTADQLIDYLTMMIWSAIEGIVKSGGSLTTFNDQPHVLPISSASS